MADDKPTPEEWRPVVGHEGRYEVSDHGRVRSLPRESLDPRGWRRTFQGRILKVGGSHYPKVTIEGQRYHVHRLVLEAFVGACPPGMIACHWDDNPYNNRLTNLRWGTYAENARDQVRNGGNWLAIRSHCKHGHEFTPENTIVEKRGTRACRECGRRRGRAYESRRKAARVPQRPATHCNRGHEFTDANTYVHPSGSRVCRECRKVYSARYRNRKAD